MEDLENELDRLRKTALIHKQLERFVEDSMFKLEELGGRFEIEEKKTSEMEISMAEMKRGFNELDSTSANIIIVEEELRKDFRLLEEEFKVREVRRKMQIKIIKQLNYSFASVCFGSKIKRIGDSESRKLLLNLLTSYSEETRRLFGQDFADGGDHRGAR